MKKLPLILAAIILAVMGFIAFKDGGAMLGRKNDLPPVVEFTWSPAGAVSLYEMKAKLHLADDHALDFKTYKMTLVEMGRDLKLPLAESLIGKDYEDTLSFSLFALEPKLVGKDKLTVRIEIADDAGQKTSIEKIIRIKPAVMFEIR